MIQMAFIGSFIGCAVLTGLITFDTDRGRRFTTEQQNTIGFFVFWLPWVALCLAVVAYLGARKRDV